MDLILWRHAEAVEGTSEDLNRPLTSKGRKQASRAAQWLLHRLPARFSLIASPARRAQQTAEMLRTPVKTEPKLAPGASAEAIIEACGWPGHKGALVVVGHQPNLGHALGLLLTGAEGLWSIKKGALWWLSTRVRDGDAQVVVRAVLSPDLL